MRTSRTRVQRTPLELAATKQVKPRAVSRAAQWQWVLVFDEETAHAIPDYPARATAKERQSEHYCSQVEMRALRRGLKASGNGPLYGQNGELISGCAPVELPTEHPMSGAAEMLLFVGPVAVGTLLAESKSWTKHRARFRKQAVRRAEHGLLLGYTGSSRSRIRSFEDWLKS